jgi:hypothetical protein
MTAPGYPTTRPFGSKGTYKVHLTAAGSHADGWVYREKDNGYLVVGLSGTIESGRLKALLSYSSEKSTWNYRTFIKH